MPTSTLNVSSMPKKSSIDSHARPGEVDIFRFFRKANYSHGEMARIRQILRSSGRTLILPYDQFIEHDCRHLDAESDAGNPDYIINLAIEGSYNGVAIHYGIAKRYWSKVEGAVPLILKINGKTAFPSQKQALSSFTATVEDAVCVGAVAVGYTMYYGTPREYEDIQNLSSVRRACDRYGMPLIIWAYPRGEAVDAKGGKDSSYALESAARMAMEMGASIIKSNLPKAASPEYFANEGVPSYYRRIEKQLQELSLREQKLERARRVVQAAQGIPILFSGGEEKEEGDFLENSEVCLKAGCFGFIFGRNMWKRSHEKALELIKILSKLLDA